MTPGLALVTGSAKRLGKAMALSLADAGWDLAVHYNSSSAAAEETAAEIQAKGRNAATLGADLSDEAATGSLIARAQAAMDAPVTLLVNSASTFFDDTAEGHSREDWDRHFEPNLRAPIHLAQTFAQHLPAEQNGLIVNLIDQRVWKLNPQFFTYTLTKAALWTATRTLAQALAPRVRVNGIGPGPTLASIHQSVDTFDAESQSTLTGRGSSPAEIVQALHYLIAADSVTGQMIACDGGQHLLWQTPDLET
ncbi:MAG: SDR family oxidoreductase [Pseudomonadota bacterium]